MDQNNYKKKTDREVFGFKADMPLGNSKDREEREQRLLQELLSANIEGSDERRTTAEIQLDHNRSVKKFGGSS